LSNPSSHIVADASVVINLIASRFGEEILRALPQRMAVVDIVLDELNQGLKNGKNDVEVIHNLADSNLIEVVSLGDVGEQIFEQLVIGLANETLDDGEAASIGYACEHSLQIAVDERKARRKCMAEFPALGLLSTIDIFKHLQVQEALGKTKLSLAVLNALQWGRMKVLQSHHIWVVELIGQKQVDACRSLPGYLKSKGERVAG
jgi:predicted nucleic acid-binding protein